MIGTAGCVLLCDLLSWDCGTEIACGADMPIEPDTPSGELAPGIVPEPKDPESPDVAGDIAGIVDRIPEVIGEVAPEEEVVGVAAGYVGSEALGDAYPPVRFCAPACGLVCGARAGAEFVCDGVSIENGTAELVCDDAGPDEPACGWVCEGDSTFAVTTPSTRSPITKNSPAMIYGFMLKPSPAAPNQDHITPGGARQLSRRLTSEVLFYLSQNPIVLQPRLA